MDPLPCTVNDPETPGELYYPIRKLCDLITLYFVPNAYFPILLDSLYIGYVTGPIEFLLFLYNTLTEFCFTSKCY